MGNKEYRIKEEIYGDGHKVYTAQYAINCLFFKFWRDFIIKTYEYGTNSFNIICCGNTYEDCKKYLIESIKEQNDLKMRTTIDHVKFLF